MAIKKAYICDCCGEEIPDFFYKIEGFNVYLTDCKFRSDDLIVCKECMKDIFKVIVEKRNVNFNIDVTTE